jgi:hypothetical protein
MVNLLIVRCAFHLAVGILQQAMPVGGVPLLPLQYAICLVMLPGLIFQLILNLRTLFTPFKYLVFEPLVGILELA